MRRNQRDDPPEEHDRHADHADPAEPVAKFLRKGGGLGHDQRSLGLARMAMMSASVIRLR